MKRSRHSRTAGVLAFILCMIPLLCCSEEKPTFEASEIEKKAFQFGGYLEFKPVVLWPDKDSPFYQLNFYDKSQRSPIDEYNFTLQLNGKYEKGIFGFYFLTNSAAKYSYYDDWDQKTTIFEGYGSLKPTTSLSIDAGQKTMNWGKGYAFNPVAFVDRPKNPDDPELSREGWVVATADYTMSYTGALKTLTLSPVFLPVYEDVNNDFGKTGYLNFGGKAYLLLHDTDIDLMFLTGSSRTTRYGVDFSRNIGTNFEVHGEFAWINNFTQIVVDSGGKTSTKSYDAKSWLLGIRYLTERDTTYIAEWYHNGTGFRGSALADFFSFERSAYGSFNSSGNTQQIAKALQLATGPYGAINNTEDYFYLRVSQKEPFDILYFTPAITLLANTHDKSFTLTPELLYTGITNLELRLRGGIIVGPKGSEFGEKQNNFRAELRARYYF